jgi:pimeloyl-ACP methyl ester carboxylesterase
MAIRSNSSALEQNYGRMVHSRAQNTEQSALPNPAHGTEPVGQPVDVAYQIAGEGPAVVAIQGVGVIGNGWRPQIDELGRRFRMVTFDNRGIGRSAPGTPPLTIEDMAGDVVALMNTIGVDRAHVIGHSMGGLIALHVALTVPERVKSLALLCTFADGAEPGRLSLGMVWHGLRARVGTRAMRRNGMMSMIMPAAYLRGVDRSHLAEDLAELFGRDLADHPPIVSRQLEAMSKYNCVARLREIRGIPTLIASGADDPIAPSRLGRAIADGVSGARFVEFSDASHALPIQCPREINTLLLQHLTTAEL